MIVNIKIGWPKYHKQDFSGNDFNTYGYCSNFNNVKQKTQDQYISEYLIYQDQITVTVCHSNRFFDLLEDYNSNLWELQMLRTSRKLQIITTPNKLIGGQKLKNSLKSTNLIMWM